MANEFDLVVIGTGTAAATVAAGCRAAGWSVAVVDSRPYGGTCAQRGCDPKKVLVGAAEALDWARRLEGKGVKAKAKIDWKALMQFKRTFTDPVPASREKGFEQKGIATFHGRARFTGPTSLKVGPEKLEAKKVVIAAGAEPMELGLPGEKHLRTSDDFLELKRLPKRVAFIGGGYISFEFAHVARRAGAEVTILHRGEQPLVRFDPALVEQLVAYSRQLGIKVRLNTEAKAIEKTPGQKGLVVKAVEAGKEQAFEADLVVHGAGRVPAIAGLNLKKAGVEHNRRGVRVNEYLQSVTNAAVYAAGDAAGSDGPPLTPVAGYEGRVVTANLLGGNQTKVEYGAIPSVAFTVPPLAAVGLSEKAAQEQGLKFRVNHGETSGWFSSRRIGEECSGFKVMVEEGSERILGAHLLGPQAEEIINLFALAMQHGLTASQLGKVLYAYPTHASDVQYML